MPEGAYFCGECGTLVNQAETVAQEPQQGNNNAWEQQESVQQAAETPCYCTNCGAAVSANEGFCGNCGARIDEIGDFNPVYAGNAVPTGQKSNKGLIIAVIVLAAILVIGIAAVFMFIIYPQMSGNTAPSPETTIIPAATEAPVATPEPTPTPTPIPPPKFTGVTASSTRGVDYTKGTAVYYPATNMLDGDVTTCWSCDRNIELTPTVRLYADTPQHVTGIKMSNGYFKSEETYTRNRRITKVRVSYNGGSQEVDMSIDMYRVMKDIVLPAPVDTDYIEIKVLESYSGDWKDVCISEIEVY